MHVLQGTDFCDYGICLGKSKIWRVGPLAGNLQEEVDTADHRQNFFFHNFSPKSFS